MAGRVAIELVYEPEGRWDIPVDLFVETSIGVYIREEGFTYQQRSMFYPWDAIKSVQRYVAEMSSEPSVRQRLEATSVGHRIV